jgi:hypothetical protein
MQSFAYRSNSEKSSPIKVENNPSLIIAIGVTDLYFSTSSLN